MANPDPVGSRPQDTEVLSALVERLSHWCGVTLEPGTLRQAVQSHLSGGGHPSDLLVAIGASCGLRIRTVPMTVEEAVHQARPDSPMVFRRSVGNGVSEWRIVVRRGRLRVRVDQPGPGGGIRDMNVSELNEWMGPGDKGIHEFLLVEAALPASAASGREPVSEGAHDAHGAHSHGRSHASPLDRVRALARLERRDLWTLFWYAVGTGLLYLAIPMAVDAMVSNIAFGGQQQVYVQALVVLAAVLGAFLVLHALVRALAFVVIERLQRRLFVRFTADLAGRLPRVVQSEFDQVHGPELTNRFFDIMTLQKAAAQLLLDGLDVVLSFLAGAVVLAFYDWTLFWFDAGLLVLVGLVIWGFGRGGVTSSIEESRAKYATAGWLQQVAMFGAAFKAPGGEDLSLSRADAYAREYLGHRRAHFRILFRQVTGLLVIEVVASAALLLWGGFLVLGGQLSLGQLVASELILTATLAASAKFGKQLETAYDLLTAVDKIGHLVDLETEPKGGTEPRNGSSQGSAVAVDGVGFSFVSGRPVFHDLSLRLPAGSRIALVAEASSGSTTLLDLLFGLRIPEKGHIEIDDLDLRQWSREALRRHVARVAGDESIFDGSVYDNVRMGNESVGVAEVRDALRATGLLRKVQAMEHGLDEPIALLGRSLSGTERRQVLLARAIARAPRLLLLDGTLDGFEADEIDAILGYLCAPERPWTLLVVSRDPDVLRRFTTQITLPSRRGVLSAKGGVHGN
jgi:ABC-type bacteriocin/lantibiotic exporter with double-glycine peptidase domain